MKTGIRVLLYLSIFLVVATVVAACSSSAKPTAAPATPTSAPATPTTAAAAPTTATAAQTVATATVEVARPTNPGGPGPALALTGNIKAGEKVYVDNCQKCHGEKGVGGVANPGSDDGTIPPL